MHKYVTVVLCCFLIVLSSAVFAQNSSAGTASIYPRNTAIDSLEEALKTAAHDTMRVRLFVMLSEICDPLKMDEYIGPGLKLCEEKLQTTSSSTDLYKLYQNYYAVLLNNKGLFYEETGKPSLALSYYQKAIKTEELIKDNYLLSVTTRSVANLYEKLGDINMALDYFYKSLKIQEEIKDKTGVANTLNDIGVLYNSLGKQDTALKYYNHVLNIANEINANDLVGTVLMNIGFVYDKQKDTLKALEYYRKSLDFNKKINYKRGIAMVLNNIGFLYANNGDLTQALHYYEKSLALEEEVNDLHGKCFTLNNMADILHQQGQTQRALTLSTQSLHLAEQLGYPDVIRNASKLLSKIYSESNNYKAAFEMQNLFHIMKDSLLNKENNKSLLQHQLQYEYEKKELLNKLEQEKELNDFKLEAQRKSAVQNMILIVLASLLLLLAVGAYFVYRNYKQKQKIREFEKNALKQKLLLSQMNPHFIFNSIDNIQSLIHNRQEQQAITYLNGFSRLTRQILEHSTENYISLAEETDMIKNYLSIQQLLHNNAFNYNISLAETLEPETVFLPPMLTQPFIENAIKHGLSKSSKGEIAVRFFMQDKKLMVEISDNGSGFIQKEMPNKHKSMAIRLTRERLASYTGSQEPNIQLDNMVDSRQQITGARVLIEIPYIYEN